MHSNRRQFLQRAAAAGSGFALAGTMVGGTLSVAAVPLARQPVPASEGRNVPLPTLPDGATLYYEVQGSGRPMLVIHGGLGLDHSYFQPWLDPLAQRLQLIYPDLRGNGRSSDVPDADYTMEKMADDLDALREALGIRQWIVLGHSYGGFIAQTYVLKYPATVSYLILLDTNPGGGLGNAEGVQLLGNRFTPEHAAAFGRLPMLTDDEDWRRLWYFILPLYFYRYDVPSFIAADRTVYRAGGIARAGATGAAAGYDTRARLGQLTMPTLVAVGRHDWVTPVRQSMWLYKSILGSELVMFEQSGHFPFVEEQAKFLEAVTSFVSA